MENALFYIFGIKMGFDNISSENVHFISIILVQWLNMMFSMLVITNILSGLDDPLKI